MRLIHMNIELDHVFVCASPSAPEAEEFIRLVYTEDLPASTPDRALLVGVSALPTQ
jgi:hypothetical protein